MAPYMGDGEYMSAEAVSSRESARIWQTACANIPGRGSLYHIPSIFVYPRVVVQKQKRRGR